jgi:acyl carrier protein
MTDMNDLTSKIIQIAADQAGVSTQEVTRETHFINDLNFDSLDRVEFVMSIEDEFSISVPDEETEKVGTIDDAIMLVKKRLEEPVAKN